MSKKMINKSLAAICFLLAANAVKAQQQEFSIALGGGIQGIHYSLQHGDASLKPGFQLGFGYMKNLRTRWGVRTGVEAGFYQSKATLNPNSQFTSNETDSENSAFEYRIRANGYREEQKVWVVSIPLMLQFHPAFNTNGFYAQLGIRLGIPVSKKYAASADQLVATGYYPDFNVEITDLPVHGFGTQNGWKGQGEYELKPDWSAAAEAGWKFKLSANNSLYAGLYIDYGLNNIKKAEGEGALLSYQPNGLAQSEAKGIFSLRDETGNIRLMAYGIKLRMGFGSGKQKKTEAPAPVVVAPPPAPVIKDTPVVIVPVPAVVADTIVIEEVIGDSLTADELKLFETPFLFGKPGDTVLSAAAKQHAVVIAELLKKHPEVILNIEGHTCNTGTDAVNEKVGLARANAVATVLQKEGINASRLQILSKAHREPIAPNNNESNRRKNRRVILKVL